MYLLKFLGYHLIPGQKVAHTPRPRWSYSNLASHVPAGLWKLCLWKGVCFWCLLKYSNWEILGNFIWSCNSSWGRLDTWNCCPFALKWGWQREGRWEFAFHILRVSLNLSQYHTINSAFFSPAGCFLQSVYQEMFHNQGRKTGVLNCGAQGRCISRESMDRGECWISLVWLDWIFTNEIKLS